MIRVDGAIGEAAGAEGGNSVQANSIVVRLCAIVVDFMVEFQNG